MWKIVAVLRLLKNNSRGCHQHPWCCDHRLQSFILVMKANADRASHTHAQQKRHHRSLSTLYLFLLLLVLSVHAATHSTYHTLCRWPSFLCILTNTVALGWFFSLIFPFLTVSFVHHWYIETLCLHSSFLYTCWLIFSMVSVLNSIFSFNIKKLKFLNGSFEEESQLYHIVESKMQSSTTVFRWWLQIYQHKCPTVICVQGLCELIEQCVTRKNTDVFPCETLIH